MIQVCFKNNSVFTFLKCDGSHCVLQAVWIKTTPLYLLLISLSSHVALLNVPVAEEVSEVAEDGEDAIAHVGEHGHQERRLLVGLLVGLLVQTGVDRPILLLWEEESKNVL